ncbi:MAG TPA: cytidylate kinase-like family protein [Streptosporangiaceae bacterium]|nr:cytidylate kinase-like family protein [Streptosporangiaceae bacterium]
MTAEPVPTSIPADLGVRLITVSASYGAGGSVVAPGLAERLGLPFLQRVTTSEGHVAEPGPCDEQLTADEVKTTPVHRLLAHFTQAMPAGPTQSPPSTHHQDEHLRGHGEAGIHRLLADDGGGVILGRAAAVVLGKDRGFHVRLDGPAGRRVAQGATVEGISQEEAERRLGAADKARTAYVRRLYRCDPADPALYHLVIDSTAIPLDTVIELIAAAARATVS